MPLAASLTLLTPTAALVGLAVLVPLAALVLVARRRRALRRALGAPAGGRLVRARDVIAFVALFGLLAAAASQPVLSVGRTVGERADVEAYVIFDVSRSMLASAEPGSPSRFDRAQGFALDVRSGLAGIPVGVASLTDRPLPHVFPTSDTTTFDSVVATAIGIERPPPEEQGLVRATTFESLEGLATENFFSAGSAKRAAIVLTDGESRSFESAALVEELAKESIALFFVRFWDESERVFEPDGTPESYRPDPDSNALLASLSESRAVSTFEESEPGALIEAVQAYLGPGPIVARDVAPRALALAPWLALLAAVPLALVLVRRPR